MNLESKVIYNSLSSTNADIQGQIKLILTESVLNPDSCKAKIVKGNDIIDLSITWNDTKDIATIDYSNLTFTSDYIFILYNVELSSGSNYQYIYYFTTKFNSELVEIYRNIKLNALIKKCLVRLAAIGISDVYELLTIDNSSEDPVDGFEVMHSILQDTITKFEYLEPFCIKFDINIENGEYTFVDNFKSVINGEIDKKYMQLIPRTVQQIGEMVYGVNSNIYYEITKPTLKCPLKGTYSVNCICNRPLIWSRDGDKYSQDSAYYFISELDLPKLKRLTDLLTVNIGKYLIRLDENTQFQDVPVDVMKGLSNYISDLENKNNQDFETSHGYADIYGFLS